MSSSHFATINPATEMSRLKSLLTLRHKRPKPSLLELIRPTGRDP